MPYLFLCFIAFLSLAVFRGGSRTAATSKVELFVITVNGWKPLTINTKGSTFDVAAVLDPPLVFGFRSLANGNCLFRFESLSSVGYNSLLHEPFCL